MRCYVSVTDFSSRRFRAPVAERLKSLQTAGNIDSE